ncbi:suppressor of fused domain protein [Bacillus sp. 2205SS5-2]|uniref:suppressor of fused domain protein n=1 Tax=Bacillus sp. 2205SS5-2 TaxID=3109031 RepID=UPI003005C040
MNEYVKFLEDHLGMIEQGWSTNVDGEKLPFNVVKFKGGPFSDTVTYSTLGLSHHSLINPDSNKIIKHELFIVADSNFGNQKNIPPILHQLGQEALDGHNAYLRGQVIGPRGRLFKDTNLEALYATVPVYFPDSFHVFDAGNGEVPTIQVWMVPITKIEADFVMRNGWSKFEDLLVDIDPDLIDFTRASIIV